MFFEKTDGGRMNSAKIQKLNGEYTMKTYEIIIVGFIFSVSFVCIVFMAHEAWEKYREIKRLEYECHELFLKIQRMQNDIYFDLSNKKFNNYIEKIKNNDYSDYVS